LGRRRNFWLTDETRKTPLLKNLQRSMY
jgi:hypothetical protein